MSIRRFFVIRDIRSKLCTNKILNASWNSKRMSVSWSQSCCGVMVLGFSDDVVKNSRRIFFKGSFVLPPLGIKQRSLGLGIRSWNKPWVTFFYRLHHARLHQISSSQRQTSRWTRQLFWCNYIPALSQSKVIFIHYLLWPAINMASGAILLLWMLQL